MTVYDSVDEDVWNVLERARFSEGDMEWALQYPDKADLSEDQKKIFEHNLPIFKKVNKLLKSLKG